jgi:hypothetical protein
MSGGCRCGQVRFAVASPPLLTMACHCTGCQRMTGGPYSLSVMVGSEGFEVTAGEPVRGGLRKDVAHNHCPHCMSWVFTRLPDGVPFVNVRATLLDDPSWFTPFMESYTAEMLSWAKTPAKHSFERHPAPEEWRRLMAEYAALGT